MTVLVAHHSACSLHDPGPGHPEAPSRLDAVFSGLRSSGVSDDLVEFEARRATRDEIGRVHGEGYVHWIEEEAARGADLDPDTAVGQGSFEAALRAAGAGLDAADRLVAGEGSSAFLAVRPPGHHASGVRAMGFCVFNNVAITAAALLDRGERVLVLDWDAHHGNGTQAAFYDEPDVLFISLHQYPAYPGTGSLDETGAGEGAGATINVPFPRGTTGDAYRRAFDELVVPAAELFSPTWLLVSAGFDAHRADPLTDLGLSAGDFADLTASSMPLAAPGRRICFLEGGYDLEALARSAGASVAAMAGERYLPERVTGRSDSSGGVDELATTVIAEAAARHEDLVGR